MTRQRKWKKADLLQEMYAGAPKFTDAELQMAVTDCRHRDSADLQHIIVENSTLDGESARRESPSVSLKRR